MSEKVNFAIFFNQVEKLPSRIAMVELLFSLSSPWLHIPGEWMLLDWSSGETRRGSWSEYLGTQTREINDTTLLFVYDTVRYVEAPTDCISVEKGDRYAVYTLSISAQKIQERSLEYVNNWLISLYTHLKSICAPLIAGGSEFELQGDKNKMTPRDFMIFSLSEFANCYWVVLPDSFVLEGIERFDNVRLNNNFVLLYDKNLERINVVHSLKT